MRIRAPQESVARSWGCIMQLKWIEDLLVLERTRSFSRAAELRHITQSALSRRIRSLEDWVGAELVDRNTYPLALTRAGAAFCETAGQAADLLLDARAALRREASLPGNAIDIAAGHTLSLAFLPAWLKRCQQRFGDFHARVVAANVLDAVVALSEGHCDLMLGYNHPRVPVSLDAERFLSLTVGADTLLPVSAPRPDGRPRYAVPPAVPLPCPPPCPLPPGATRHPSPSWPTRPTPRSGACSTPCWRRTTRTGGWCAAMRPTWPCCCSRWPPRAMGWRGCR